MMNYFRRTINAGINVILCLLRLSISDGQITICQRPLDVSFVVYSGPEISDRDWNSITSLISNISSGLSLSTYVTHVSVIHFSKTATTKCNLGDTLVLGSKLTEVGRNMSGAIWKSTSGMFTNTNGDRPEVPDKMIVITTAASDNMTESSVEAAVAKSLGIHVVTVGVGTNSAMIEELKAIATYSEEASRLLISNADQYSIIVQPIIDTICAPAPEAACGDIRLVDGNSTSGRLEMYWNIEWVTVSNANWTMQNTRIACKQLGYPDGVASFAAISSVYSRRIGLTSVQCFGNETNLLGCQHDEFFVKGNQFTHLQDVFLRCLCGNCNDYVEHTNVLRLADGTSMSGRLDTFLVGTGYMSVCRSYGWTDTNARVACRELKFADEAGKCEVSNYASIFPKYFTCTGTETALSNCPTTPLPPSGCYVPVCIRCFCSRCTEILVESPRPQQSSTGSIATFEWIFYQDVSTCNLEIWFMSSKNPQLLLQRIGGMTTIANTNFKDRIRLVTRSKLSVSFDITNVWRTDIGWYALHITLPTMKIYNQQTVLFVTDFAILPPAHIACRAYKSVEFAWYLRLLENLCAVTVESYITTPPSGRLLQDYYYNNWLPANKGYNYNPKHPLIPSIYIKAPLAEDRGDYVLDIRVTCNTLSWLDVSYSFRTSLAVEASAIDSSPASYCNEWVIGFSVAVGLLQSSSI